MFFAFTVLWLAVIIAAALLSPPVTWSYSFSEAPLQKNMQLQILSGEDFTYEVLEAGQNGSVTISSGVAYYCKGTLLFDRQYVRSAGASAAQVCVDSNGLQVLPNGTVQRSNASYGNVSWPYFQPWMLALREGWEWEANASFNAGPFQELSTDSFKWVVVGSETYLGRDGWVVVLYSIPQGGGQPFEVSRTLVDKQKRITLVYSGSGVGLRLLSAPFLRPST